MLSKRLELDKLIGFELALSEGEELVIVHGSDVAKELVANVTVRVEGTAEVYYGNEQEPGRTLGPGTSSLEGNWAKIANYDSFKLKVVTPTFRYYCLRDYKSRNLNPTLVRIPAGESRTVPQAKNLFLAMGQVTVSGQTIQAPAQIKTTAEREFSSAAGALMVSFDIPQGE